MTPQRSFKKMTKCICPNCKKEHMKKMYWTGSGIPKKYCHSCAKLSNVSKLAPNNSIGQRDHHFYGVEEK